MLTDDLFGASIWLTNGENEMNPDLEAALYGDHPGSTITWDGTEWDRISAAAFAANGAAWRALPADTKDMWFVQFEAEAMNRAWDEYTSQANFYRPGTLEYHRALRIIASITDDTDSVNHHARIVHGIIEGMMK